MTPRQKYDVATAGWCVVAAAIVYLVLAFISMDFPNPFASGGGRLACVTVGANIVLWGTLIRSDHRPHY